MHVWYGSGGGWVVWRIPVLSGWNFGALPLQGGFESTVFHGVTLQCFIHTLARNRADTRGSGVVVLCWLGVVGCVGFGVVT